MQVSRTWKLPSSQADGDDDVEMWEDMEVDGGVGAVEDVESDDDTETDGDTETDATVETSGFPDTDAD